MVIKRDGRTAEFDVDKIKDAIRKAMSCTQKGVDELLIQKISDKISISYNENLTVDEIQDRVEHELMKSSRKDVAKEYIAYRHKRDVARKAKTKEVFLDIIKAEKNDVTRENANMNADTPAGMMMKFASETTKPFVDDYLLSEESRLAVESNYLHIHDKDYYPSKSLTCVQHPLDNILKNGFVAGHGESRPAKRIETASVIACISLETAQNEMHGGQAIPAFDFYMAPYVRSSYIEEVKNIEALNGEDLSRLYNVEIKDYIYSDLTGLEGDEKYIHHAINRTVNRVHQAMEAFIHNMNTIHSRGGNQVVFSSINYGTDTSAEGRCVIRELLRSTYEGVGGGSTAIFPIQIWKKKRGVSYLPGDPNYDLYKEACKVTAKRFFPNFVNLDAPYNTHEKWKSDDPERYKWEVATMGCVDKDEIVSVIIDGELKVLPIGELYKIVTGIYAEQSQDVEDYCSDGHFVDPKDIKILDDGEYVDLYRIIKNPDKGDWYKVKLTNGRVLTVTSDHPWSIFESGEVKRTIDLNIGDKIGITTSLPSTNLYSDKSCDESWLYGFILCDGCYDEQMMSTVGMDEMDIVDKYCSVMEKVVNQEVTIKEQHRGYKGDYIELKNFSKTSKDVVDFRKKLLEDFRGMRKIERNIPNWVFNSTNEIRAAFLAGMMDADGYINDKRKTRVCQLGSTNKALAIETAMLVQTFGIAAKIYENHYSSDTDKIRYRVEFDAFDDLVSHMASKKKFEKYEYTREPIVHEYSEILSIEYIGYRDECSYDVTTSSEHFTVSGIRSHNCRTRVFENRFGEKTSIGRGNLSFTTLNIVRLAIEVMNISDENERISLFFEKLDNLLDIAAKQLNDRFNFQKTAMAKQFQLVMSKLWTGAENLKPNDTIESVINQGTLGIGFIGLAECLIALTGHHHAEDPKSQELGIRIVTHMRDRANEYSEKYQHNYSILATPAEGLSGKFTKKDKKDFGIIPGVTDKDYYTNSNHVPVYYHCSPRHKAEIESPYHDLTRGGHIFYVEIDGDATHNPEAIMQIVDLMDEYNIGYGSINHNRNRCLDCGYEDASKELHECPICKGNNIDVLQRITGYLVGTTDRWNSGKVAELKDRIVHK